MNRKETLALMIRPVCAAIAVLSLTSAASAQPALTSEEAVQQIYVSFYGRPGDPDGVAYWAGQAGTAGVLSILSQFSSSAEATQLFGGMSDEGKITFIYRVMFNRDPETLGLSYWAGELSSGRRTLQDISYTILTGAQNTDLSIVTNKIAASVFFSNELNSRGIKLDYTTQADILLARNWIGTVGATQASLDAAKAGIAAVLTRISAAGKPGTTTGVLATPSAAGKDGDHAIVYLPQTERAKARATTTPSGAVCFGVPEGYSPLGGASVTPVDAFGNSSPSTTADECGIFVAATPPMATSIDVAAAGYRPVRTSISTFQDPNNVGMPQPLTLIPTTSTYQLSGVRLVGGNRLYFNVTDSASKKSVLGISASQVAVKSNTLPMSIASFGYGASVSNTPASVAMVLDASGSMGGTPFQVAAASARLFVSRKSSADALSLTLFDSRVTFLNQANTATMISNNRLNFTDGAGVALTVTGPLDGYTTNPLFPEQMLKLYDPASDAWKKTDSFFRVASGSYPFGGSTALYSAALAGINSLTGSANRRYALVMTDGLDNASGTNTVDTVISAAKANNVATYTVAAGSNVDSVKLRRIATETGGTYTQVTNMTQVSNLSAVFDAIRTNIAYDYAARLSSTPASGTLTLTVDVGGSAIESSIAVGP